MSFGSLSNKFRGVAVKRLSEVEVNPRTSNQHELGTTKDLREILGVPEGDEKRILDCELIYLDEFDEGIISEKIDLTYYDTRFNQKDRSPEYRLYYPSNTVIDQAEPRDSLILGVSKENSLMMIITPQGSTSERQALWLFGFSEAGNSFVTRDLFEDDIEVSFAGQYILDRLGIRVEESDEEEILNILINEFGEDFPTTKEFSEFARSQLEGINPVSDPGYALNAWFNREWSNFKIFEKYFVSEKLEKGFEGVDEFVRYSLSIQNRRKSRAGHALENHLEQVFLDNEISYSRNEITENNNKPDFLFPGIKSYRNPSFPSQRLTILAAKTSCKDRWRQVIPEAARVSKKHLFTLQDVITENQTQQMQNQNVQLIVPNNLFVNYTEAQCRWLMNLNGFVEMVKINQE